MRYISLIFLWDRLGSVHVNYAGHGSLNHVKPVSQKVDDHVEYATKEHRYLHAAYRVNGFD